MEKLFRNWKFCKGQGDGERAVVYGAESVDESEVITLC